MRFDRMRRPGGWLGRQRALAIFGVVALSLGAYFPQELIKRVGPVMTPSHSTALLVCGGTLILLVGLGAVARRQLTLVYGRSGDPYSLVSDYLGRLPRVISAAALLMGYVLAVAISASAAISTLAAVWPVVAPYHVVLAVGAILISCLLNMRGRGLSTIAYALAGTLFSCTVLLTLALAARRLLSAGKALSGASPTVHETGLLLPSLSTAPLVLLVALSAISAVIIGVGSLPRVRLMPTRRSDYLLPVAFVILFLILGGTTWIGANDTPGAGESILSHIAAQVYGTTFGWYLVQATTAAVLLAAAQTPFPRVTNLIAVVARDGYLPKRFAARHDRRARADSIAILALAAAVVVLVVHASLARLIPWFIISTSTSFLLAQTACGVRCIHHKLFGWRRALISHGLAGLAACATLVIQIRMIPVTTSIVVVMSISVFAGLVLAVHYTARPTGRPRQV